MSLRHPRLRGLRHVWLATTATVAIHSGAHAAETAPEADKAEVIEEVVVTGSRIQRDGYATPTPVASLPAEQLLKAAPGTIFEALATLPQMANTSTSINTTHQNIGLVPGTVFNLRGLGRTRTLVLMDGTRFAPTYQDGTVDVDIIPQMLVQRVETVTGGASAVYGSDAVAGVVNFILDKTFTGTKITAQGGVSSRGDYENYNLGLTHGRDLGERTHILASANYVENWGFRANERPQYYLYGFQAGQVVGSTAAAGTAANPRVTVLNSVWNVVPWQAIATSGPFRGAVIFGNGEYHLPAISGLPTGSAAVFVVPPTQQGGRYPLPGGGTSDLTTVPDDWTQAPHTRNATVFARINHDFGGDLTGFVQAGGAKFSLDNLGHAPFTTGTRIFSGNPYLPAALQGMLTTSNTPFFTFSRQYTGIGSQESGTDLTHFNLGAGLDGKIDRFAWRLRYQHGQSDLRGFYNKMIVATNFAAASDAVRDSSGRIVCAPTLSPDPAVRARYAGCVPFSVFGDEISPAAFDYITGNSVYKTKNRSDIITADISGDLFDLWAGPVSAAAGFEFRRNTLDLRSNSDPSILYDITGLRAITAQPARFFFNNVGVADGSVNVKEGFAEIAIPLAKDMAFAKALELNGAVRYTDYSTSGPVTTWKGGFTWSPIEDVRFRLTRSRDIRAPNLQELFLGPTQNQAGFTDQHTAATSGLLTIIGGGNPDLRPEKADTLTYGVVLQPRFLPGFRLSVDYYDIKINDAIFSLTTANIVATCELSGGTSSVCDLIKRPLPFADRTPANFPLSIRTVPINLSKFQTRGIDIASSYRTEIGEGVLNASLAVTYLKSFKTQDSPTTPSIQYAGKTDTHFLPKVRGNLALDYQIGDWSLFLQEELIGKVSWGPLFVYANRDLPKVLYTHVTVSRHMKVGDADAELFLNVRNLFDKDAPIYTGDSPAPASILDTQTRVYDVVGRTFTGGVRLRF